LCSSTDKHKPEIKSYEYHLLPLQFLFFSFHYHHQKNYTFITHEQSINTKQTQLNQTKPKHQNQQLYPKRVKTLTARGAEPRRLHTTTQRRLGPPGYLRFGDRGAYGVGSGSGLLSNGQVYRPWVPPNVRGLPPIPFIPGCNPRPFGRRQAVLEEVVVDSKEVSARKGEG
jgi:hypothetical protein